MKLNELAGDLSSLAEVGFSFLVLWGEDVGLADGKFAVAIAASGGLGNGIKAGEGAIDCGEIDIDPGFDELGGDEADSFAIVEPIANGGKDLRAMLGAHEGGEMEVFLAVSEKAENIPSVLAAIHDTEGLGMIEQAAGEIVIRDFTERL